MDTFGYDVTLSLVRGERELVLAAERVRRARERSTESRVHARPAAATSPRRRDACVPATVTH